MVNFLLTYSVTILGWVLVLARLLRSPRWPRTPAQAAIWLVLLGFAVSQTLHSPFGYYGVWQLTGVNVTRPIAHISMLMAGWGAQVFLLYMSHPEAVARVRSRRRALWLVLSSAALVAIYAVAPDNINASRGAYDYTGQPWVLEYWLAFLSFLAPTLVSVALLCRRYARQTTDLTIRLGLRIIVVGAIIALVYQAHRVLFYTAPRLGFEYLSPEARTVMDWTLSTAAHVLILIGATMPGWGPRVGLSKALSWLWHFRAYQRLRPLWHALYEADPRIALDPSRSRAADLLSPRDLDLRLYRRIIEIRDGRLTLLPYLDPQVAAAARERGVAAGLTGPRLEAEAEAAALAAAIEAKAAGAVPPRAAPPPVTVPGGTDLDSDISFLCAVAHAFRQHHRKAPSAHATGGDAAESDSRRAAQR
jgi:hypothetical protein